MCLVYKIISCSVLCTSHLAYLHTQQRKCIPLAYLWSHNSTWSSHDQPRNLQPSCGTTTSPGGAISRLESGGWDWGTAYLCFPASCCSLLITFDTAPYLTSMSPHSSINCLTSAFESPFLSNGALNALAISIGLIETFRPRFQYPKKGWDNENNG